jgi:peptidyl-prolyl cis-trans isomerase D
MIRAFQKDTRLMKAVFIVIIGFTCITMVIFLVPGIFNDDATATTTFATIRHGGIFGRVLPAEDTIPVVDVQQAVRRMSRGQQIPYMIFR